MRVFGFHDDVGFCNCPAYPAHRNCFHMVGLRLFLGKLELPEDLDDTPLALGSRGNKRKAPARGAVPIRADEKDLYIQKLEVQLRRLKAGPKPRTPDRTNPCACT